VPVAREAFPALRARPELCYLDSAATSLLPQVALDAMTEALAAGGSAGRSGHGLGSAATEALAGARRRLADTMGVPAEELVITGSATDGLMLAAQGAVGPRLGPADRLVVGLDAHHGNLLPWRALAERTGAELVQVGLTTSGELDRAALREALTPSVRAVALTHVSNVTGAVLPVARVAEQVRAVAPEAWVVVDGTQAVPQLDVRPADLDVDLYLWSAHKAYGPLGCGFAWAPAHRWRQVEPVRWGGGMVSEVGVDGVSLREVPSRFEAGTLNHPAVVSAAVGAAFLQEHRDPRHGRQLARRAAEALGAIDGVSVLGAPFDRVGLVSFTVRGVHPHDVAQRCEERGILLRAGQHCAEPALAAMGVSAVVRASFGLATTVDDVERLVDTVREIP